MGIIPVLLGVQQIAEGHVLIGIVDGSYRHTQMVAPMYLFFLLLEPRK